MPIRVGLQRYVVENKAFLYAETGLGIGFFPFSESEEVDTKVNLSYAFGGGYRFYLNERKYLQTSLSLNRNHYDREFKFTWINLRVAYGLTWDKSH